MDISLHLLAPYTEASKLFLQGMLDRMATSYAKYGAAADAFPKRVDAVASLELRLQRYRETGNREWLMDVANFAMIEFMHPRHPEAHFRATDSRESPGRKWVGEKLPHSEGNTPDRWEKK